jgi:hypothetical protein
VHAAAWKEMFDGYLRERAATSGERFVPFDPVMDYDVWVPEKRFGVITRQPCTRGSVLRGRLDVGRGQGG